MNRHAKSTLMAIFAVVLTVFLVIMELSLRLVWPFSPTANQYIHGLLDNHPIIIGTLWTFIMVAGLYVAYAKYSETKKKSKLVFCLLWLVIFVASFIYLLFLHS